MSGSDPRSGTPVLRRCPAFEFRRAFRCRVYYFPPPPSTNSIGSILTVRTRFEFTAMQSKRNKGSFTNGGRLLRVATINHSDGSRYRSWCSPGSRPRETQVAGTDRGRGHVFLMTASGKVQKFRLREWIVARLQADMDCSAKSIRVSLTVMSDAVPATPFPGWRAFRSPGYRRRRRPRS